MQKFIKLSSKRLATWRNACGSWKRTMRSGECSILLKSIVSLPQRIMPLFYPYERKGAFSMPMESESTG